MCNAEKHVNRIQDRLECFIDKWKDKVEFERDNIQAKEILEDLQELHNVITFYRDF